MHTLKENVGHAGKLGVAVINRGNKMLHYFLIILISLHNKKETAREAQCLVRVG